MDLFLCSICLLHFSDARFRAAGGAKDGRRSSVSSGVWLPASSAQARVPAAGELKPRAMDSQVA